MDQVKIGSFIATKRKEKGYTQKQLAEILNISNKTISKWECGNGFPEVSLLLPLCKELNISVNELLSGEEVADKNYKRKAEENMVNMVKEREENKKRSLNAVITGIIATVSFITIIMVLCAYTEVISTPVKVLLVIVACTIFALGLYVTMQGERTIGYYRCANCNEHFVPSKLSYTKGIHLFTLRRMKCPKCGKVTWCKKVMSKED